MTRLCRLGRCSESAAIWGTAVVMLRGREDRPRPKLQRMRSRATASAGMPTIECGETSTTKKPAELPSDGFCQRLMQRPYYLVTQLLTNFRRANHPSFWSFACFVHSAVFSFRAALSAADIFAASAGAGMNAVPLTSTMAVMQANNAVTKRD